MRNKLLMLKGLPSSGKTTYAKGLLDGIVSDGNGALEWKRVNKDDLRAMVDGGKWSRDNEKEILHARNALINTWLENGFNVICDDTNFAVEHENVLRIIADTNNADFEVKFFDVPLGVCLERDAKRGEKSVGSEVICQMYEKYIKKEEVPYDENLPDCYIFDIDGTLATMNGRSPYDYSLVHTDLPNDPVVKIYKELKYAGSAERETEEANKMFIFSGRKNEYKEATEKWLTEHIGSYDGLFMRESEDNRKDSIVKLEFYENNIKGKYNVLGVFDDRLQMARAWYELGLPLFRVGNPDSNF